MLDKVKIMWGFRCLKIIKLRFRKGEERRERRWKRERRKVWPVDKVERRAE